MIRTRFAPSPTGFMHVGGLRTALYEYLIAKNGGGTFVLRIEDTDQKRQVEGAEEVIYKTLKAVGLEWDEGPEIGGAYGPYIQSQRKDFYLPPALDLIKKGAAYYCFCEKREEREEKELKYDKRCSFLKDEEIKKRLDAGEPYVIRQNIPTGETSFYDQVFSEISIKNEEIEDQILIKSDLTPTYNFANVVDDHAMRITHVVRGCEYLTSTPKYKLLYEALGWEVPVYIHLPLILSEEGGKLSKRRGDATFDALTERGFLPAAIINYLAILGWSSPDNREIFSLEELIKVFDVKRISKASAAFSIEKLSWLNGEYLKKLAPDAFRDYAMPEIKSAVKSAVNYIALCDLAKGRIRSYDDIELLFDFIDNPPVFAKTLFENKKSASDCKTALEALLALKSEYQKLEIWGSGAELYALAKKIDLPPKQIFWALQIALTGKTAAPGSATELAAALGKKITLERIETAIKLLN